MSHRALGAQFKERLKNRALDYYDRKVGPIHEAIIRKGEQAQPGIDEALANWEKAWRNAG